MRTDYTSNDDTGVTEDNLRHWRAIQKRWGSLATSPCEKRYDHSPHLHRVSAAPGIYSINKCKGIRWYD